MTDNCTLESEGSGTEQVFRLAGVLDFATVPEIHARALRLFPQAVTVTVDLGGVTLSNSAGLALLIEWQRLAAKTGLHLSARDIPENLINLARVCELEPLLPKSA